MASQVVATPAGLDSHVPRIVVTEPSPLIRTPSTVSIVDKTANVNGTPVEMAKGAIASAASPVASAQTVDQLTDSSDEYNPMPEPCIVPVAEMQCIAPVAEVVEESRIDMEEIDEESSTSDPPEDFRHVPGCCSRFGGIRGFYYSVSAASESIWATPFWILLMALPVAAGFMGARYVDDCRYSPATPALLFMMGITGVIMISVRCILMLGSAIREHDEENPCLQVTLVITYVLTIILFCTELMTFWRFDPSFDIISPNYCDPTFYAFTYWINWTAVVVLVLTLIVRCPVCLMSGRIHS